MRVRSLLRIKRSTTRSRSRHGARRLNRTLEDRVQARVGELGRLRRLRRFLSPQLVDAIVSSGNETIVESHRTQVAMFFTDLAAGRASSTPSSRRSSCASCTSSTTRSDAS